MNETIQSDRWPRSSTTVPTTRLPIVRARWEFLNLSKALGTDLDYYTNVINHLKTLGWTITYTGPNEP